MTVKFISTQKNATSSKVTSKAVSCSVSPQFPSRGCQSQHDNKTKHFAWESERWWVNPWACLMKVKATESHKMLEAGISHNFCWIYVSLHIHRLLSLLICPDAISLSWSTKSVAKIFKVPSSMSPTDTFFSLHSLLLGGYNGTSNSWEMINYESKSKSCPSPIILVVFGARMDI